MTAGFKGIGLKGIYDTSWKQFFVDLWKETNDDNVFNGGAALAFYLTLAIFPGMIFLLNLLPYLPIPNQSDQIYALLREAMPGDAASALTDTVRGIVAEKRQGLLSFGALFTLWAATSGMAAVMEQLNITYDVKEGRNYLKVRGTALLLTMLFGACVVGSFLLILVGEEIRNFLDRQFGLGGALTVLFEVTRWVITFGALSLAFALVYYFGPDVKQRFRFITPGSVFGVLVLAAASFGFKMYVENFGSYNATYGSIGAVIVLMLWLNITGLVVLLGSEVNSLVEHYSPEGKIKGEKVEGEAGAQRRQEDHTGRPPLPPRREETQYADDRKNSA